MKRIVTITGASGVGKDSLVDALLGLNGKKDLNEVSNIANSFKLFTAKKMIPIKELISHTTRQPREGEKEGIDYYYVDMSVFDSLEKVEETEYAGNHYCLARSEVDTIADNGVGIVVVDQYGVKCIKAFVDKYKDEYEHIAIFLKGDESISYSRMSARGDSKESIEKRIKQQRERGEYNVNDIKFDMVLSAIDVNSFYHNVISVQKMLDKRSEG